MDMDNNVGKVLVALSLEGGFSCSPFVQAVLPPGTDPEAVGAAVLSGFKDVLNRCLPGHEIVLGEPKIRVNPRSGVIKPPEERRRESDIQLTALQDFAAVANTAREQLIDANPDNGKAGYLRVDGVRHSAIVRANSARTAIDKVLKKDTVGSWESPDAEFIGAELPEVLSV